MASLIVVSLEIVNFYEVVKLVIGVVIVNGFVRRVKMLKTTFRIVFVCECNPTGLNDLFFLVVFCVADTERFRR